MVYDDLDIRKVNDLENNREEYQQSYILEEWKPVIFEDIKQGLYMVSSLGKVCSYANGKELSTINNKGYRDVGLQTQDNGRRIISVHRLVATMFCYNPDPINKIHVNHKNLIRRDNSKYNLEWVTPQENSLHAAEYYKREDSIPRKILSPSATTNNYGRGDLTFGENNGMSLWTEEQVHIMCQCLENGMSYTDTLIYVGLEPNENNRFNLSHIAQGKRWLHISCQYTITARVQMNREVFIIPVCELLSQGYTKVKDIVDELNIPGGYEKNRHFVTNIMKRQTYTEISKDYVW